MWICEQDGSYKKHNRVTGRDVKRAVTRAEYVFEPSLKQSAVYLRMSTRAVHKGQCGCPVLTVSTASSCKHALHATGPEERTLH